MMSNLGNKTTTSGCWYGANLGNKTFSIISKIEK